LVGSKRPIVIAAIATVLGSIVVGLGVWWFVGRPQVLGTEDATESAAPGKVASAKRSAGRSPDVAEFAGSPITRTEYEAAWKKTLEDNKIAEADITPQAYLGQRYAVLQQLVARRIYDAALAEYGITVGEDEIQKHAESAARGEALRRHGGQQALDYFLQARQIAMDDYVKEIAKEILDRDREGFERTVKMLMVDEKTTEGVTLKEEDLPKYLRVAHVQRIAQLFDPSGKPSERVSEADAKTKIEEAYAKLQGGTPFDQVLAQYSNGPEKADGGKLEPVPYGADKQFDAVVWTLKEGEYCKPFQGERGWHIIKVLRFEQQPVAKDPAEKQAQMREIEDQLRRARVGEWLDERRKAGNLKINDPDLAGFQALDESRFEDAARLLQEALLQPDTSRKSAVQVCLAKALAKLGKTDEAENLLKEVLAGASQEDRPALLVDRADFYLATDREEQALADLDEASRLAPGDAERLQIAMNYVQMNHPEKAKALLLSVCEKADDPTVLIDICQVAATHQWQDVYVASEKALLKWIAAAGVDKAGLLERLAQVAAEAGWNKVADACVGRLRAITAQMAAQAESSPRSGAPAGGESRPATAPATP
jgi:parvulin-like peptidyl-prolyl isomerase